MKFERRLQECDQGHPWDKLSKLVGIPNSCAKSTKFFRSSYIEETGAECARRAGAVG